jgi:putative two-component system response regulator
VCHLVCNGRATIRRAHGLKGPDIPIPGRVMAVVDVFDAVRSPRLYHAPLSPEQAVEFIRKGRGTHFDPGVVDAFEQVLDVMHGLSMTA